MKRSPRRYLDRANAATCHLPELTRPDIPTIQEQAPLSMHGPIAEFSVVDYLSVRTVFP